MQLEAVRKRYDKYSRYYDKVEEQMERMIFQDLREQVIGSLKGTVLEVGVGTGKNLPYYSAGSRVTGIDISRGMLSRAKRREPTFKGETLDLLEMNAEEMTFASNSFDIVLCTFVLCSVPDPVKAATEMLRVLKPGGRLILLEHVLSKMPLIAFFQRIFNPLTRGVFGYNIDRDTVNNIRLAAATILRNQDLTNTDVLKLLVCQKNVIS
ncbi:MAG: class I SAM-dependent methyltransferase [Candidatus Hodarchaeales archaeon]